MKKILYVHGLASSGASNTAKTLQRLFPKFKVIAPDLPVNPLEANHLLQCIIVQEKPNVIIGTSMGGMFAQTLRGKKILVNPAFHVSKFMRKNIGVQEFLNHREDGVQTFEITEELCNAYEQFEAMQFLDTNEWENQRTWGLFGTNDTLVNCQEEYKKYYTNFQFFEGEHRLTPEVIENVVAPLIKEIIMNQ